MSSHSYARDGRSSDSSSRSTYRNGGGAPTNAQNRGSDYVRTSYPVYSSDRYDHQSWDRNRSNNPIVNHTGPVPSDETRRHADTPANRQDHERIYPVYDNQSSRVNQGPTVNHTGPVPSDETRRHADSPSNLQGHDWAREVYGTSGSSPERHDRNNFSSRPQQGDGSSHPQKKDPFHTASAGEIFLATGDASGLHPWNGHNYHGSDRPRNPIYDRAPDFHDRDHDHHEWAERWRNHREGELFFLDYRCGYVQYDHRFRDNGFFFGFYAFEPYGRSVCVSPWYYYPELPPYVACEHVYVAPFYERPTYDWYAPYRWHSLNDPYYRGEYSSIDYAVDDLQRAFARKDARFVSYLAPRDGQVAILTDQVYRYSVPGDEFYSTLRDAIENVRTVSYEIVDVRTQGDDVAIEARHETESPWGQNDVVYHLYRMHLEGGSLVIREFGTSRFRRSF